MRKVRTGAELSSNDLQVFRRLMVSSNTASKMRDSVTAHGLLLRASAELDALQGDRVLKNDDDGD